MVRGEQGLERLVRRAEEEEAEAVGAHRAGGRGQHSLQHGRRDRDLQPVQEQRDVGLVQRRREGDQVPEVPGRALAVAGEQVACRRVLPPARRRQPARQREVVEGDHRCQMALVARRQHPPVVVELRAGKETLLRLDARPLDREAVRVEAEPREELDVVGVAVVMIAGVARRLGEQRRLDVLEKPVVVVDVVSFDLVRRGRRAPQEPLGEDLCPGTGRPPARGGPDERRGARAHEEAPTIHLALHPRLRSSGASPSTRSPGREVPIRAAASPSCRACSR